MSSRSAASPNNSGTKLNINVSSGQRPGFVLPSSSSTSITKGSKLNDIGLGDLLHSNHGNTHISRFGVSADKEEEEDKAVDFVRYERYEQT